MECDIKPNWPIYKYQPITTLSLGNLAQRKLWAPSPTIFNDPFECRLQRAESPRGLDVLRSQNHHLDSLSDGKLVEQAIAQYEAEFSKWGLVCFAQHPNNILMWPHYADQHRGMCLGFENKKPLSDCGVYPVDYRRGYPELTFDEVWHREGLARVLFTKHEGWAYECELRWIKTEGSQLTDYPGKLCRVIFGARTPLEASNLVQALVDQDPEIELLRVELDPTQYALKLVPV
jgi:hypothetical protein